MPRLRSHQPRRRAAVFFGVFAGLGLLRLMQREPEPSAAPAPPPPRARRAPTALRRCALDWAVPASAIPGELPQQHTLDLPEARAAGITPTLSLGRGVLRLQEDLFQHLAAGPEAAAPELELPELGTLRIAVLPTGGCRATVHP